MKINKFTCILFLLSPLYLFGAEPSAFGAGDLSSSNPYGLTKNEKVLLETEKKLKTVAKKSNSQANQLDSLLERIDGLQSIVESLGREAHNNKVNLQNLQNSTTAASESTDEYQKRLSLSVQQNRENIEKLQLSVTELSKTVASINAEYVSRSEYNTLVKDVNDFKTLVAQELKSPKKRTTSKKKVSGAVLYNQAQHDFNRKRYTQAISEYEELIRRHYKPAYSHYMIGEMYYKRKNYAKAISYFKKSASLYSKASYMPNLMLHSGIAMLKTGDKAHANAFFNAILQKYPKTNEARKAKKYLGL